MKTLKGPVDVHRWAMDVGCLDCGAQLQITIADCFIGKKWYRTCGEPWSIPYPASRCPHCREILLLEVPRYIRHYLDNQAEAERIARGSVFTRMTAALRRLLKVPA